jgi:hypothetical protein
MDTPLQRVKALIWVHSVIGAGLVIAFFAVISRDLSGSLPIVGCGIVWWVALWPIEQRASVLSLADRIPGTGLPGWVRALFAVAQIGSLAVRVPHPEWLLIGHLFVGGTLLCRGVLSVCMDVPVHGRTWTTCMLLIGFGFVRHLGRVFVDAVILSC